MKIGELARAAQVQVETIRYYEREGLLPRTGRSSGNYRVYGAPYVERVAFIRHCRALDMALDEIRALLRVKDDPTAACGEVNALLDEHIGHVATRIRGLKLLERDLKALRAKCAEPTDSARCGILNGLAQTTPKAPARRGATGHVGGAHARPRS